MEHLLRVIKHHVTSDNFNSVTLSLFALLLERLLLVSLKVGRPDAFVIEGHGRPFGYMPHLH